MKILFLLDLDRKGRYHKVSKVSPEMIQLFDIQENDDLVYEVDDTLTNEFFETEAKLEALREKIREVVMEQDLARQESRG